MSGDQLPALRDHIDAMFRTETRWTRFWSLIYHGSTFSAALASALAVLVLQLKTLPWAPDTRADVAAVLAMIASFLGAVIASGGFERKWRINRLTKSTLEQLQISLMDPEADPAKIRKELKSMTLRRDTTITAEPGLDKNKANPE